MASSQLGFFDLKLSEKIGRMFEYALTSANYNVFDFTEKWLSSGTYENILLWDVSLVSQAATYILSKFEEELKHRDLFIERNDCEQKLPPQLAYWIGYTLTYWCIRDSITGSKILRNYDMETIINNSEVYHSLGVSSAISLIQEDAVRKERE